MAGINGIKPIINLFVTKPGARYVTKPEVVSIFKRDLASLRPAFDTFERSTKTITIDEVKKLFPDDKIGGGKFRKEMYKVKTSLFLNVLSSKKAYKKWKHSVDLSNPLKNCDYKEITDFMNMHDGKFIKLWKEEKDGMRNIEKLALFIRSLRHVEKTEISKVPKIDKLKFFKSLPEDKWATCIDGIVNKPNDVIEALMQYKYNSTKINETITFKDGSQRIVDYIKQIEKFLEKQATKSNLKTYRGEGNFWVFNNVKLGNGITLKEILEEVTKNIENKTLDKKGIEEFVYKFLVKKIVPQERFMSTAIIPEDTKKYAKKVLWHIDIPKGTKASFIESYNVERASELEVLIQKGSKLLINKADYDMVNHRWNIWASLQQ